MYECVLNDHGTRKVFLIVQTKNKNVVRKWVVYGTEPFRAYALTPFGRTSVWMALAHPESDEQVKNQVMFQFRREEFETLVGLGVIKEEYAHNIWAYLEDHPMDLGFDLDCLESPVRQYQKDKKDREAEVRKVALLTDPTYEACPWCGYDLRSSMCGCGFGD